MLCEVRIPHLQLHVPNTYVLLGACIYTFNFYVYIYVFISYSV